MKRIGILGVDALTEQLVRGFFRARPDAQVFLYPGKSRIAQMLAGEFPCWTLDSPGSVIDEADVVIINAGPEALYELAKHLQLRSSQTLISLVPAIRSQTLRRLFRHEDCVRLMLAFTDEINKSAAILTAADDDIQRLFSLLGPLCVLADEAEFDSVTTGFR